MKIIATDEHMIHTDAVKMLEEAGAKVEFLSDDLLKGENKNKLSEAETLLTKFSTRIDEKLLKEAKQNKCKIVSGLDMFVNQAVGQFELWTKKKAPKKLMHTLVVESLK